MVFFGVELLRKLEMFLKFCSEYPEQLLLMQTESNLSWNLFPKMDRDSEAFMPCVYSSCNLNLGQRGKGIGVRANHCDTTSTSYKIYFKEKEEKEIIE